MTHEKYQQTYNGIKVAFSEYIVHKDKEGFIWVHFKLSHFFIERIQSNVLSGTTCW